MLNFEIIKIQNLKFKIIIIMEAVAKLKNCPMSPRKMRLVVDNIRGKNVEDALNILKFTKKRSCNLVRKSSRIGYF